ncbi:MAG TPA: hypothetical protein DDW42_02290 [Desulfobacteraceae bacterium]|nr:hypothetical protein [Desulfobacteraceae bacterium]
MRQRYCNAGADEFIAVLEDQLGRYIPIIGGLSVETTSDKRNMEHLFIIPGPVRCRFWNNIFGQIKKVA